MAEPSSRSTASKSNLPQGKMYCSSSRRDTISSSSHSTSSPTNLIHSPFASARSLSSIQSEHSVMSKNRGDTKTVLPTPPPPVMYCGCREPACIITSATACNPGRKFLKCRNMVQAVNCTCYRGIKGCFLWVWEDRLEEYVKRKSEWNLEQSLSKIIQDAAQDMELGDQEIGRIRSELNRSIQDAIISESNFLRQIKKIQRSRRIYMLFVFVLWGWIVASHM